MLKRLIDKYSYGDEGWLKGTLYSTLKGVWPAYMSEGGKPERPLSYSKAHALIARDDGGKILGWAFVRHPQKRTKIPKKVFCGEQQKFLDKFAYAGRRSDFMVYVSPKSRKQRVAQSLLLVAYNNFGRVDVYPHDLHSRKFFNKMSKYVTAYTSHNLKTADFEAREIVD